MSRTTYPRIPVDIRGVFHIVLHAKWPKNRAPFGDIVDGEFAPSAIGQVVYEAIGRYVMTDPNCRLYAVNLVPNRLHVIAGLCGHGPSIRDVVTRMKAPVTRRIRRELGWAADEGLWRPGAYVQQAKNLHELEQLFAEVKKQLHEPAWWPPYEGSC